MALLAGKSNYAYATARIRAKGAKLIPATEYPKILKMDVPEITLYVQDSSYRQEVGELGNRFQGLDLLEAALTVNEERTFQDVRAMMQGPAAQLIDLYLQRYTVEALKTVLRGKLAGASRDELLREMLLEDFAGFELFNPLLGDDVKTVDDMIGALDRQAAGKAFAKTLKGVAQGSPLARYEEALDRAYFANLLEVLRDSDQPGADRLLEFVRLDIDAVNLLNAARWVHSKSDGDFSAFVLPGGRNLKVAQVVGLSRAKDLAGFGEQLAETKVFPESRESLETAKASGRLVAFQSAVRRAHMAELKRLGNTSPLSVLPILLYLIRKHNEVVTLRAVARGKAAGLSEAQLAEVIA